jgi:hypothetical protein
MSGWWNQRSRLTRLLVYAVAAILALVMAASLGAVAALVVRGNLSWPTGERSGPGEPNPGSERGNPPQRQQEDADRSQQYEAGAKREQPATQGKQIPYVSEVGEIQVASVEAFSDSHEKLLRYDTITSGDIEEMRANQVALRELVDRASVLEAPQKYREQKDAFVSATGELHQAAQLAYILAADPISATQADFDDYDRLVDEATADLQQSNEILGKGYKTIGGLQEVNTP